VVPKAEPVRRVLPFHAKYRRLLQNLYASQHLVRGARTPVCLQQANGHNAPRHCSCIALRFYRCQIWLFELLLLRALRAIGICGPLPDGAVYVPSHVAQQKNQQPCKELQPQYWCVKKQYLVSWATPPLDKTPCMLKTAFGHLPNLAFVPARPNDIDRFIRHISNRFHYANHTYRAQRHIVTVCARRCLLSVASSISARPVGQYKMTHLDKAMTPHSCTKMPNATASGYERNVSRFLRPGQLWQKGQMHAVQGVIAKNTAMLPIKAVPNAS